MIGGHGRLYVVEFHAVSVTAQQDLIYLKPAADMPIEIEEIKIAVTGGTADAGDAQEELYDIEVIRLPTTVTVGSGGSSFTPTPVQPSDTAAGFTARVNDTTVATTSGTAANLDSDGMNSRVPYIYTPTPEHRMPCFNASAVVCRLKTTPADAVLLNGKALVREFG